MNTLFKLFIFLGLVACVAYFTKPTEANIRKEVREHFIAKADTGPKGSTREFIAGGLAKLAAEKSISIKDHVVYREVKHKITGDVTAIAVFGQVFFL
ncbi:hypothetical protein [Flavihumibacter solisilvae]|uniref:Uncharacterized protein n=1 Tax=Flavihumibacter solisilvae TaxID=1349421 RepID=A0A0C1L490_9BACT|nr:hypothetical protein [Flavihumibacter solisilvae]KIC94917.1 hypothetical protein OI18_08395 [Flavihumibacter solisilvae]